MLFPLLVVLSLVFFHMDDRMVADCMVGARHMELFWNLFGVDPLDLAYETTTDCRFRLLLDVLIRVMISLVSYLVILIYIELDDYIYNMY